MKSLGLGLEKKMGLGLDKKILFPSLRVYEMFIKFE